MGRYLKIIFVLFIGISVLGCASLKEKTRCVAGVSTKELEEGRKDALRKTFTYDYPSCFSKTKGILQDIGAYIYAKDINKNMIAIYLSEQDTTPVGIFFKEIDSVSTEVEISSPSTYAKEMIAQKLFTALETTSPPQQ